MKRLRLLIIALYTMLTMHAQRQLPLILGGELSNSAVTSVDDIDAVMLRMKQMGMNTVLAPAYWEFIEPKEGEFDFTLVDRIVRQARSNDLKVVLLWFGAWKNSMSCYAPVWFKEDTKRFPRARTRSGKPLEIASCFSDEVWEADNRTFGELMKHISKTASDVVVMVQVENEVGMLEDARDHSDLANDIYSKGVPEELLSYLKAHQGELHPWMKERIQVPLSPFPSSLRSPIATISQLPPRGSEGPSGGKCPSWEEVFGDDELFTDEIFTAYYYARYVGRLCETARRYTQIPLYVNTALNSRGRLPGQYPSGGPLAQLIDIWHAGAPQLLCLAPDIYDTGFKSWADQYAISGNPLFIPESRCCTNSGARAMYAFGQHRALGFAPFAIDQASEEDLESVKQAYRLISQIEPYITGKKSVEAMWGMLFDQDDKESTMNDGDRIIACRHYFTLPWDPRATDGTTWPEGGAALIKLGKNEFLLAGTGVVVEFATYAERVHERQQQLGEDGFVADNPEVEGYMKELTRFSGTRIGIGSVDEVSIDADGRMHYIRRHNGDQDHQGRHVRIASGEWKILHIQLYEYS